MKDIENKSMYLILVVTIGLFLFAACTASVSEKEGKEVSYETPQILRDTNLGADLPFIVYETEHQIIFYNYMGIFIYDLDNSEMLQTIKPSDSQFELNTQGDPATVVNVNIEKKIINIYKVGSQTLEYFYVYDINSEKLYQYPIEQLKKDKGNPEVAGRMDTDDWTAWNLSYTSELTGETYYPFRSIAK